MMSERVKKEYRKNLIEFVLGFYGLPLLAIMFEVL